jgi:hypothetical protein
MSLEMRSAMRRVLAAGLLIALAGCGGGGSSSTAPPASGAPPTSPVTPTVPVTPDVPATPSPVNCNNGAIGTPTNPAPTWFSYATTKSVPFTNVYSNCFTKANSLMGVFVSNGGIDIGIAGDENWSGFFPLALHYQQITPGTYTVNGSVMAGDRSPRDHSCGASSTTFTVTNVAYADGRIDVLDLTFSENCMAGGTLSGQLHYWAGDPTTAPGPKPIPANLWKPDASFVAPAGNYMYVEGSAGEPVSRGRNVTLTNNLYLEQRGGNEINFQAASSLDTWQARFTAPLPYTLIPVGYYGTFNGADNPVLGTLAVMTSLICSPPASGWFVVDSIHYSAINGEFQISDLDLRFEQVCTKGDTPLHGKIHWSATPPGAMTLTNQIPAFPAPVPFMPSLLPSGNVCQRAMSGIVTPPGTLGQTFVSLDSDAGDYIGQGTSYCYTLATANLPLTVTDSTINLVVAGDDNWTGTFTVPLTNGQIQPGTYKTGASWGGNGRGCGAEATSITISNATYVNGSLNVLDLNFHLRCYASTGDLNGVIHWWADDPTRWPGPATTGTQKLWKPMPAFVPPAGNYVYLEGTGGDYVSAGLSYLYTPEIKPITIQQWNLNAMTVRVGGLIPDWQINLQGSQDATRILPGLYKSGTSDSFNNPVTGRLSVSGLHRGCNSVVGWYIIDKITYSNATSPDQLTGLDARFEQYCLDFEGSSLTPLHGQIHWIAN